MLWTPIADATTRGPKHLKTSTRKTGEADVSTMTINGEQKPLPDDADALLADVIRDQLNLTGTKLVCGSGVCGA